MQEKTQKKGDKRKKKQKKKGRGKRALFKNREAETE